MHVYVVELNLGFLVIVACILTLWKRSSAECVPSGDRGHAGVAVGQSQVRSPLTLWYNQHMQIHLGLLYNNTIRV